MKTYIQPTICITLINGKEQLLEPSVKIDGTNKVENASDIGYTKERKSQEYDVWSEDWSK